MCAKQMPGREGQQVPLSRGGLALFFGGGIMALKGSVGHSQALNGCGHLKNFSKL